MMKLGKLQKYFNPSTEKQTEHRLHMKKVDDRFSWVMDDGKYIALLEGRDEFILDLWRGVAEELDDPSIPQKYHAPNMMGARITLAWWCTSQHIFSKTRTLTTKTLDDGSLVIRLNEEFDNATAWREARVFWSEDYGRYMVDLVGQIEGELPRGRNMLEFVNLYPFGIFDDRTSKRYQRTYFSGPDCGQVSFAQNPLVPYLNTWRPDKTKRLCEPYSDLLWVGRGDYFGYGIEEGFNPFLIVADDSMRFERSTCCCLQDEHFSIVEEDLAKADCVRGHVLLTYLNREESEKLASDSRHLTFDKGYPEFPTFPPDADGIMRAEDPAETNMRSMWFCGEPLGKAVEFVPDGGPSGKGELVVQGPGENYSTTIYPAGTSFHLHPGKKHIVRVSIKVDGENTFGQAWVSEYLFRLKYDSPRVSSGDVPADGDWHQVELEFKSKPDCDFWNLFLEVRGTGSVHFSNFEYIVE